MTEYRINYLFDRPEDGEANLRVRIKWNGNKTIVSLLPRIRVEMAKWSKEFSRCVPRSVHTNRMLPATLINGKLEVLEQTIQAAFDACPDVPTKEQFMHAYNVLIGKESANKPNLLALHNNFVADEGLLRNWSLGTHKSHDSTYKHLKKFKDVWTEDDFTSENFNCMVKEWEDSGIRNSTIAKYLTCARWFLRWLSDKGYYNGDLHKKYHPRLKKVEDTEGNLIIYLTWDELLKLYSLEMPSPIYERVRDGFCFCCFTSLRYSDLYNLKRTDVTNKYIKVTTIKTGDSISIDLNDYSRAILDKYKDKHFKGGKALPVYPNAVMNRYLKHIAKLAGFTDIVKQVYYIGAERHEETYEKWEKITTHCGRRTFIVNALYLGIPAEVIIRWTGHADYEDMRPYIAIVDDLKAREMDKFNKGVPKTHAD